MVSLPNWLALGNALPLPSWVGITGRLPHPPAIYMGSGSPDSGLHDYTANALPLGHSPGPKTSKKDEGL